MKIRCVENNREYAVEDMGRLGDVLDVPCACGGDQVVVEKQKFVRVTTCDGCGEMRSWYEAGKGQKRSQLKLRLIVGGKL